MSNFAVYYQQAPVMNRFGEYEGRFTRVMRAGVPLVVEAADGAGALAVVKQRGFVQYPVVEELRGG